MAPREGGFEDKIHTNSVELLFSITTKLINFPVIRIFSQHINLPKI